MQISLLSSKDPSNVNISVLFLYLITNCLALVEKLVDAVSRIWKLILKRKIAKWGGCLN